MSHRLGRTGAFLSRGLLLAALAAGGCVSGDPTEGQQFVTEPDTSGSGDTGFVPPDTTPPVDSGTPIDTSVAEDTSGPLDTGVDTAIEDTGVDTTEPDTAKPDTATGIDAAFEAGGDALDPCGAGACTVDSDGDGIPDSVEGRCAVGGAIDTDKDGIPDYLDLDSDGDGISDKLEWPAKGCDTGGLNDADGDGIPNFRDLDSDGNGMPDKEEACPPAAVLTKLGMAPCAAGTVYDFDGDGVPDFLDADNDHDSKSPSLEVGLEDRYELIDFFGTYVGLVDTDKDGIPDVYDRDSDNDGILDNEDGLNDLDTDLIANFRDTDSDGDGVPDACEKDVDTDGDGKPDFLDLDSDGDLLSDKLEDKDGNCLVGAFETDRLKKDTDGDGVDDLIETTLIGEAGAKDATKTPANQGKFYFVVPWSADGSAKPTPTVSTLAMSTALTKGDVGFIVDTTRTMSGEINELKKSLSTVIIPELKKRIGDLGIGVAGHEDIQSCARVEPWSDGTCMGPQTKSCVTNADCPSSVSAQCLSGTCYRPVECTTTVDCPSGSYCDFGWCRIDATTIYATPVVNYYRHGLEGMEPFYFPGGKGRVSTVATDAQAAADALIFKGLAGGSDEPEAQIQAMYKALTGAPLTFPSTLASGPTITLAADTPPAGRFGALHFREDAFPILVSLTDAGMHNGKRALNHLPSGVPSDYDTVFQETYKYKPPAYQLYDVDQLIAKFAEYGARYIGVAGDDGARAIANTELDAYGYLAYIADKSGAYILPSDFTRTYNKCPATDCCADDKCCTGVNGKGIDPDGPMIGGKRSCRLVFSLNSDGTGLGKTIVEAVYSILSNIKFDVHVRAYKDAAATIDPVDAFMDKIEPQPAGGTDPITGGVCVTFAASKLADNFKTAKAVPGAGDIKETISQLTPGALHCFSVTPKPNTTIKPGATAQVHKAWLSVRAVKGITSTFGLGVDREVIFLVPPLLN